jgi:hypothetical protein
MPASDLAGPASTTIAELLAKLGTDPKTGLNPTSYRNVLTSMGQTPYRNKRKARFRLCLPISGDPYHG